MSGATGTNERRLGGGEASRLQTLGSTTGDLGADPQSSEASHPLCVFDVQPDHLP